MFNQRNLNPDEIAYIKRQVSRMKSFVLTMFVILVMVFVVGAYAIYIEVNEYNLSINLFFGMVILVIYTIYSIYKNYQKHIIDPRIYDAKGVYKRIYESHGGSGRFYDTINGSKVTIPWHWRSYLKSHKEPVSYKYIERDYKVAAFEGGNRYIISINDTLALDYELTNGLKKAKPVSFVGIFTLFLIIPFSIILFLNNDLENALNFKQIFQNESQAITLNSAEDLTSITTPSYVTIQNAWVHEFKTLSDYLGTYSLLSQSERDRIYKLPNSDFHYQFVLPPHAIKKPNKETFAKSVKDNPLLDQFEIGKIPDSIWNKTIDKEFNRKLKEHNRNIKRAKEAEIILEGLQPKTTILELDVNTFNPSRKSFYSIKKSLENPVMVQGFYNLEENSLISFEEQEKLKQKIQKSSVVVSIWGLILPFASFALARIIYNMRLKKRLVENQINSFDGPQRLSEKK